MDHTAILPTTLTRRRPVRSRRRGFTLVEALLALIVTALVGTATVAMLAATAYGATNQQNVRTLLVKTQTCDSRIGTLIRTAREVLAPVGADDDYLVVWVADANDDDAKQQGEMQLVTHDSGAGELRSYRNPADATDFVDIAAFRAAALASYTPETWATGVTGVEILQTRTSGAPLVSYRLTVEAGADRHTAIGAASPRQ